MKKVLLTLAIVLALASYSHAVTRWVATAAGGGSNSNSGTEASPYLTITFAYGLSNAGDTVMVKPGVYSSELTTSYGLNLNRNGSSGNPITVMSQVKHGAIIDPNDHVASRYGVSLRGDYNILDGFVIRNSYHRCISAYEDNNIVRNNVIHNCGNQAETASTLGLGSGIDDEGTSNTFINNYVHSSGRPVCGSATPTFCNLDHGYYGRGTGTKLINNIFANNKAYGIHFDGGAGIANLKILNNISYGHERAGVLIADPVSGASEISNNILVGNGLRLNDPGLRVSTGCTSGHLDVKNNIIFGNSGGITQYQGSCTETESGTITSNPDFVDAGASDFYLQDTSPAIDAGITLTDASPDIDGTVRPEGSAYDIGPYEFIENGGGGGGGSLPANLVAQWTFDDTLSDNVGVAHGTFNGGTASYVAGQIGNAIVLDGVDDYVSLASTSVLDFSGTPSLTIAAWIKPATANTYQGIYSNTNTLTCGSMTGIDFNININVRLRLTTGSGTNCDTDTASVSNITMGEWQHVAVTVSSGGVITFYRNGAQVGTTMSLGVSISNGSGVKKIGRGFNASSSSFKGNIDEVQIYNRTLNATEIGEVYAYTGEAPPDTTPPTDPSSLVATTVSEVEIGLAWTGSTDEDSGVSHYEIERCQGAACTTWALINTSVGVTYPDADLTSGTLYRYRVRAVDNEDNASGYSNIDDATTLADTTAPTNPSSLVPTVLSQTEIDLSWNASTDEEPGATGLSNYVVESCEGVLCIDWAVINSPTEPAYSHTGLTAGTTYGYRVKAVDNATNESGYSSVVYAETDAVPANTVSDPFDGTADPLGGIWTDGVYGVGAGGCKKLGGYATKSGGGNWAGCYVTETFAAKQYVEGVANNPVSWSNNTTVALFGCIQTASVGTPTASGYMFTAKSTTGGGNDLLRFYRSDGGAFVAVGTGVVRELAAGDSWKMEILEGGVLNGYYKAVGAPDWELVTTETDTTYSCADTHIGLNIRNTSQQVAAFAGGDLEGEEPDPPDPPPPPADFPTTAVLDTFTGANQNPITGIWSSEALGFPGGCQRIGGTSNVLKRATGTGIGNDAACYVTEAFGASQEVYADYVQISTATGIAHFLFCLQDATVGTTEVDGYALGHTWANGFATLKRIDGGPTDYVMTQLGDTLPVNPDAEGDGLGVRITANGTITAYFKDGGVWSSIGERSDTTHNCANSHIGLNIRPTTLAFDNFGGGTIGPPASLRRRSTLMEFK